MSDLTIARRYAQALAEQAVADGKVQEVDADMAVIRDALEASDDLRFIFSSPVIPRDKKAHIVKDVLTGKVDALTVRFLEMLIGKRRETIFGDVVAAYSALRDKELGVTDAQVRVALELSDSGKEALVSALESLTGGTVRMTSTTDESLIGGIVIQIGDRVYDGSAVNQLATLRERLAIS